jgi:hypothetical protein
MPRFFAATASPTLRAVRPSFRSATDSLHPSAERAPSPQSGSDVPCRSADVRRGFHLPTDHPTPFLGEPGIPASPGRFARKPVTAHARPAQDAFGWISIPTFPPGLSCLQSNGLARRLGNLGHPCRAPQPPSCHGVGCHDHATPCRAASTEAPAAHQVEDTSHQPLQSISCHEHPGEPMLPSTRLAPCRPPLPGPPRFAGCFAGAGTDLLPRRRRKTTGAFRPRMVPRLTPLAPAGTRTDLLPLGP